MGCIIVRVVGLHYDRNFTTREVDLKFLTFAVIEKKVLHPKCLLVCPRCTKIHIRVFVI